MSTRRGWGEDGIFFEHTASCRDSDRHRHCQGRWRGAVSLGSGPDGKRIRRKVSGTSRAIVQDRLRALHGDLESGVRASPNYTVRRAAEDWLAEGLDGRSAKTIKKNQNVLAPILTAIGARRLRELTAADVRQALTSMAARYSTAAVAMGHNALTRAIRHAEGRDLVGRNVATLVDTPKGQAGRPSRSLTLDQASALLAAAQGTRMHAYIALCLATGIRTEEARALRWEHVDFGDPDAEPPVPASAAVWRSVRSHADTKTEKSRRTLALPHMAVDVLRTHKERQAEERQTAGARWNDHDLVFATSTGAALDAANVRRQFRAACKAANIGQPRTPRELRHSFVSLMSSSGVPVEEIARLAGHSSSRTTEVVYRRELRPVLTTGAEVMDTLFTAHASRQADQTTANAP
jgi:integrase